MRFLFSPKIVLIAVLSLFAVVCGCEKDIQVRRLAPDFSLKDLSGDEISLEKFKGKVVILDFWATWCPPCRQSIPELIELQNRYRDKGLVVLGISMDDSDQTSNNALQDFKQQYRINYTILRSGERVAHDFFGSEQMAIPTMFVINREGEIAAKHVGYRPGALEKSLKEIL
ncbi:MAG: peroxiredoxin family protein [Desulfatiglandales bacterium]